jgi:hypothetical protein
MLGRASASICRSIPSTTSATKTPIATSRLVRSSEAVDVSGGSSSSEVILTLDQRRRRLSGGLLHERDKVVLPGAVELKHEKGGRTIAAVGNQMGPARLDRVRLARPETHLFLGVTEEEPKLALDDIEGVPDVGVAVPGHLLGRSNCELGNPEARPRRVFNPTLDVEQSARVLVFHRFHGHPRFGHRDRQLGTSRRAPVAALLAADKDNVSGAVIELSN